MRLAAALLTMLFPSSVLLAGDQPVDRAYLRARIMEHTKLVAVMDLEGPSSSFKGDGNPNTLEVVFLSRRSDGPSRVSPDGEVVFLYKASEKMQAELISKAFDLRVASATAGG